MTSNAQIPDSQLPNEDSSRSGWQPGEGFMGLIPGTTTLSEACRRLGEPESRFELLNATSYSFQEGAIRVTVPHDKSTISKIHVSASRQEPKLVPADIEAARLLFGPLRATRVEKLTGIIFERPGLRIACEPNPQPEPVRWVEFYLPGS